MALAHASPLERGITTHFVPEMGGFVCTFNTTHPERYNFWLEDEGEQLWCFGNYPQMMKLYGKPLRDFIVEHCKQGFPVRRVNNQPLIADPARTNGNFWMDTGLLEVEGRLAENPQINLHHSAYEPWGLLGRIGSFYVSYEDGDGAEHRIDLTKPTSCSVSYHKPERNRALLALKNSSPEMDVEFDVVVYRARVSISAKVTNKKAGAVKNVVAGFGLLDCKTYFKRPLNCMKRLGDVAILYSEQPELMNCNIVRMAGLAARGNIKAQRRTAASDRERHGVGQDR